MRAGGAGGGSCRVRPLRPIADGNVSARQVHDARRNEKGRNAAWTTLEQDLMLALDNLKGPDPASDVHSRAFGIVRADFQAGCGNRELRRCHGELDESPHLLDIFFVDKAQRIEILDLTGDLAGEFRSVELRDPADAALPAPDCRPTLFGSRPG